MTEYYFKEGCYIDEIHNTDSDDATSLARVRVEARAETKLHALRNTTERYIILNGRGRVTVGDKHWEVVSGDVVLIKAEQAQKIKNLTSEDLLFKTILI
jgi:mannose-6-phosphate isomerase-like protein (cupin superfamily)